MADTVKGNGTVSAEVKKAEAKAKADYDFHVLLIMRQDTVNKSKAQLTAYKEGSSGINVRLNG